MIVSVCEACGGTVLDTQPRVSVHGPLNYRAFIGGGEFDALLKQAGYVPPPPTCPVQNTPPGTWEAPRLLHLWCAQ